jgi:hypothetical protein
MPMVMQQKRVDIDLLIVKDTKERVIDRIVQIYKIVDIKKNRPFTICGYTKRVR